jgi:hypothetical protein
MIHYDPRKWTTVDNGTVVEIVSEYGGAWPEDLISQTLRPVRLRYNETKLDAEVQISNATAPTGFIRHQFYHLANTDLSSIMDGNYTLSVYAPQPVVQVMCNLISEGSFESDTEVKYIQDITLRTATISTLGTLIQKLNDTGEMSVSDQNWTIHSFEPVWIAAPELRSQAWIGIFFQHFFKSFDLRPNETIRTEPIKLSEMASSVQSL